MNVENFPQALLVDQMCKVVNKENVQLEGFQDNLSKKARDMGYIFCDTLNGKMVEFPKTLKHMNDLENFTVELFSNTNLDSLQIGVNGMSFSIEQQTPPVGSAQTYLDIYEIGSQSKITPDDKVFETFSNVINSETISDTILLKLIS